MATILIVDDRPTNRQFLVTLLGYAGHRLLEAADGQEALDMLRTEKPDLVISDLLMPTMDGFEFVQNLRADAALAPTKVIFYTATYRATQARLLAEACGVEYVIAKPAEPQEILDTVGSALGLSSQDAPPAPTPAETSQRKPLREVGDLHSLRGRMAGASELGLNLLEVHSPEEMLTQFCEAGRKIMRARYAAVATVSEDEKRIRAFFTSGLDAETVEKIGSRPVGKGVLGRVLAERRIIRVADIAVDPQRAGFPPHHPPMRSFMGVPILTSTRLYGICYYTDRIDADEFDEEDEGIAQTLAAQLAVLYENTVLYDQLQRHAADLQLEITERKQAQEALRKSQEFFENAFHTSPISTVLTQLPGRTVIDVNAHFEQTFGYRKTEIIGKPVTNFDLWDDPLERERVAEILIKEGKIQGHEFKYKTKFGRVGYGLFYSEVFGQYENKYVMTKVVDITERKRADEQMRYQAQLLAKINDAVIASDENFMITAWNRAAEQIYGWSAGEALGQGSEKLIRSEFIGRSRAEAIAELNERGEFFAELIQTRKDGTRIYVEARATTLRDGSGRIVGYVSVNRDITEHKRAEEAMRKNEEFLSIVFKNSEIGIFVVNVSESGEYRYAGINPAHERLLGLSNAQVTGKTPADLAEYFGSESMEYVKRLYDECAQKRETVESEFYVPEGPAQGWWLSRLTPLIDERTSKVYRLIGSGLVITERKRAEEKLRESEQKFSTLFDKSALVAGLSRLPDGVILDVNKAFEKSFGYTRQEALGKTTLELGINPDAEGRARRFAALQAQGSVRDIEVELRTKSGEARIFSVNVDLVDIGDEKYILNTMQDVTERKQAEEELRRVQTKLLQGEERANFGSWELELETQTGWWSPQVYRIFERDPSLGPPPFDEIMELVHPEDRAVLMQGYAQSTQATPPVSIYFRTNPERLTPRWLQLISETTRDASGKPMKLSGNMLDVTERKQAEEQLRERERQLSTFISNLPGAVFRVRNDPDYTAEFISDQIAQITGYPAEDFRENRRSFGELMHPDDREWVWNEIQKALGEHRRYELTYRFIDAHGEEKWSWESGTGIFDANGGLPALEGFVQDITERKRAEYALRESEARFRALVENIPGVVYVADLATVDETEYISPQVEALLGFAYEDWLSDRKFWSKRVHRDDLERVLRADAHSRRTGEPLREEYRLLARDGRVVWVRDEAAVIQDGEGRPAFLQGVWIDITERKRAEQERALLHRVRIAVANELDLDAILRALVESVAGTYGYSHVSAYLRQDETLVLQHQVGYAEVIQQIPIGQGVTGRVARTGQPELITDVRRESNFLAAVESLTSEICVPLFDEGSVIGVLNIESAQGVMLAETDLRLLTALGESISPAIGRARLYSQTIASRDRLGELSRRLVQAHETESRTIGRELHDQIGQMLTALKLTLSLASQLPPAKSAQKLTQAQELADDLLTRVSSLSLELRPPMLDDLGLLPALLWHVNRFQEQTGIQIEFKHSGIEKRRFDPEIETTAYRIVQEALTNVARHAQARHARLEIHGSSEAIDIGIADDGTGLDPKAALERHRGLSAMRERAQLVRGTFQIESEYGKGTKLFIELPLKENLP